MASTVINHAKGNTAVSVEMRHRVCEAAEQLGYRPDFASRSLARRSTQTLGIYVPVADWTGIGYSYEGKIVRGIEQACRDHGFDLLLINLSGDTSPEACFNKFAERRIDGLVVIHGSHDADWFKPLIEQHSNVVGVNFYGDVHPRHSVNFDDHAATRMAVEHLIKLGHRRIGYLGSLEWRLGPGEIARYHGYRDTMVAHGLEVDDQWVIDRNASPIPLPVGTVELSEAGRIGADHILSLGDLRPTALVTYGDWLAVHAHKRFRERGVRLPDQMSIVGIDDAEVCQFVEPQLTSIRQPIEEMGRIAAERLITGPHKSHSTAVSPPQLVIRESTGRVARASFTDRVLDT